MHRASAVAGFMLAAIALSGCTDRETPLAPRAARAGYEMPGDGRRLAVDAAGWPLSRLEITAEGGRLAEPVRFVLEAKEGQPLTGAVELPPGDVYRLSAVGYDAEGRAAASGEGELLVDEKWTPQVDLALAPLKEHTDWAHVRVGTFRVELSTHELTVGRDEDKLLISLVDADGMPQPLEPGSVRLDWPRPGDDLPKLDLEYEKLVAYGAWRDRTLFGQGLICIDALACTKFEPYDGNGAVQITAGSKVTCVRRGGGSLKCWGANRNGETGEVQGISQVASLGLVDVSAAGRENASGTHVCGVDGQGRVWCWGRNVDGELGNGQVGGPTDVQAQPQQVPLPAAAIAVAAGGHHSCALVTGGSVYCWGDASMGQLGDGTYNDRYGAPVRRTSPVRVNSGTPYVAIAAGDWHSCALTGGGDVHCWGRNENRELGVPQAGMPQCYYDWWDYCAASPVQVAGVPKFASIAAGYSDTCGVSTAGEAWCWGHSYWGNTSWMSKSPAPTLIGGGITWKSVSVGYALKCGLDVNGYGACWGDNNGGQLGNGTTGLPVYVPVPRSLGGGQAFFAIDVGSSHACVIRTVASLMCWGVDGWNPPVLGYPNGGLSATPQAVTVAW